MIFPEGPVGPAMSSERIAEALERAIVEHRLPPGAKLPEDEIGEHYGVGRTVVRGALQRLAHGGLVTLRRHKGASVAEPGLREAREVFEARALVEAVATRSAGVRSSEVSSDSSARSSMRWPSCTASPCSSCLSWWRIAVRALLLTTNSSHCGLGAADLAVMISTLWPLASFLPAHDMGAMMELACLVDRVLRTLAAMRAYMRDPLQVRPTDLDLPPRPPESRVGTIPLTGERDQHQSAFPIPAG